MRRLPILVGTLVLIASVVGGSISVASLDTDRSVVERSVADHKKLFFEHKKKALEIEKLSLRQKLLTIEDAETGERLLSVPVSNGTTVALNYTHSVEKTPVLDVYAVNGTELEMVRMEFRSYGAGLPARANVTITENGTFVFDPEGSYDHIFVTPGRIAGHELVVGDRTYDLVELSDARSVKLSVTTRTTTDLPANRTTSD